MSRRSCVPLPICVFFVRSASLPWFSPVPSTSTGRSWAWITGAGAGASCAQPTEAASIKAPKGSSGAGPPAWTCTAAPSDNSAGRSDTKTSSCSSQRRPRCRHGRAFLGRSIAKCESLLFAILKATGSAAHNPPPRRAPVLVDLQENESALSPQDVDDILEVTRALGAPHDLPTVLEV